MIYTLLALELARDRAREADRHALARAAGRARGHGSPPGRRPGSGSARALVARPVRVLADAAHALSEAACAAATLIEGPAA